VAIYYGIQVDTNDLDKPAASTFKIDLEDGEL
jgi:hypothetical protein